MLLRDIRHARFFNSDERSLLIKYVLTIVFLGFPKSRKDALRIAQQLRFREGNVKGVLKRRFGGCEKILRNPEKFLES
jgi:hypothetical protein